jgi:hypothetical protein
MNCCCNAVVKRTLKRVFPETLNACTNLLHESENGTIAVIVTNKLLARYEYVHTGCTEE